MVSDKIKALLSMKGKKYKELAHLFGISEQAMRNKFARGSFSADELIKIADFVNCQLAFNIDNEQKVILTTADLRISSPAAKTDDANTAVTTNATTANTQTTDKPVYETLNEKLARLQREHVPERTDAKQ